MNKLDLKVLYVGGSGEKDATLDKTLEGFNADRRMASFETLLDRFFTQVTVMKAGDYRQEASADYDVTVIDGTPPPIEPRRDIKDASGRLTDIVPARYFTEDFDRAVLLVAELGQTLGRRIGLKLDWYCLCLGGYAHSMRADHPIFHGPFPLKRTIEERPTPKHAFHYEYYRDTPTPKTLPMWQVQTRDYETDEGFRVGMVSRPWGFEDSPDAEYISSGSCAKDLGAVALGRHGNFFGWGFAASPDSMTEEAKTVFANAVAYISRFNGKGLMVRKYHDRRATKDYAKELKYLSTREAYESHIELNEQHAERMAASKKSALAKQARGEKLNRLDEMSLSYQPAPEQSFEGFLKKYQKELFEQFGMDSAAYARYYDENYDYFYSVPPFYKLIVDEDVKSLGISNTNPKVLARAIALWEQGIDEAKARRILTRYTLLDYQTVREWHDWFRENRSRLFFTQSGGFVFMVDTNDPTVPGNSYAKSEAGRDVASDTTKQEETDMLNPVNLKVTVNPTADGAKELVVTLNIHPGFHVYAQVGSEDPFITTKIAFELPAGYSTVGPMKLPPVKHLAESDTTVFTDEVAFSQVIAGTNAGTAKIAVTYQACDDHVCLPPAQVELQVPLR